MTKVATTEDGACGIVIIDGASYQRGLQQGRVENWHAIALLREVVQQTVDLVGVHSTRRDEDWHRRGHQLLERSKTVLVTCPLPDRPKDGAVDPVAQMAEDIFKLREILARTTTVHSDGVIQSKVPPYNNLTHLPSSYRTMAE